MKQSRDIDKIVKESKENGNYAGSYFNSSNSINNCLFSGDLHDLTSYVPLCFFLEKIQWTV